MFRPWRKHRPGEEEGPSEPSAHEREILDALTALRDTTAREVMTPRVDVVALAAPVSVGDVMRAVRESGHSRFPVYDHDLDHLIGVLFVKDLFRSAWKELPSSPDAVIVASGNGGGPPLAASAPIRRLRKPFFVPEGRHVLDVLAEMRLRRNAFAVVVDEYGGVEGVITVKDLVSELVGELPDEFDVAEEDLVVRVDADRWLVAGDCPIDDLNAELGLALPPGDYVTLGGFLFERFGHIPDEGEQVDFDGWEFRVAEMERRRIAKVVLRAPSGSIEGDAGPPADGM